MVSFSIELLMKQRKPTLRYVSKHASYPCFVFAAPLIYRSSPHYHSSLIYECLYDAKLIRHIYTEKHLLSNKQN